MSGALSGLILAIQIAIAPAIALPAEEQILIGGGRLSSATGVFFSAPGVSLITVGGATVVPEVTVGVLVEPGSMRLMRVKIVTNAVPKSGDVVTNLRLGLKDTGMGCKVSASDFRATPSGEGFAFCQYLDPISIANGGDIAVKISSSLSGASSMSVIYSMIYD